MTARHRSSSLEIYYQNVRGLRTKADTFFESVLSSDFSIYSITETWLCPDISSSDYFPPNFVVHRRDREGPGAKQIGGGVLIAVNSSLESVRRSDLETHPESLWVEVRCNRRERVLIGVFYLAPQIAPGEFSACLSGIERVVNEQTSARCLILGDFNAPGINWDNLHISNTNFYISQKCNMLINFTTFLGLTQHNATHNHLGNTLDLCFSDMDELSVTKSELPMVPLDKHHPALNVTYRVISGLKCPTSDDRPSEKMYNFAAGDYVGLYRYFSDVNWCSIMESHCVNNQVENFTRIIRDGMDTYIPLKKKCQKHKFPHWFSAELRSLLKRKSFAHRKWKKSGLPKWELEFKCRRSECKTILNRDRLKHRKTVESDLTRNPKKFWQYVSSRSSKADRPKSIVLDGAGSGDVSEMFARHFKSVYTDSDDSCAYVPPAAGSDNVLSTVTADEQVVEECIKKMKPKLSTGHDGIPSALIKAYHDIFIPVICKIFNTSLKSAVFPEAWKLAVIVPVYKSGKSEDISNYRPISLLSSLSKLFEMVVHKHLSFSFKNLIAPSQHGFVYGRSTTTNLVTFMSTASHVVCNRGQLDVVYFDLSKAFDLVDHKLLLSKLSYYGVCGQVLAWFKNYLLNREGYVRVNNFTSATFKIISGVPQGSILGPLLFSIFVNDVQHVVSDSFCLQYADDTKIYREIRTVDDCIKLQNDANSFNDWCKRNKLSLNRTKTKVMTLSRKSQLVCYPYRIHGDLLSRVSQIRDLGVIFDSSLRFDHHVTKVVCTSLRMLGVSCRLTREFSNPSAFLTLYCALCRSQLEYGSVVWNGICSTNSSRIERVQQKFISIFKYRYLAVNEHLSGYEAELRRVNILSLCQRREKADILFLYKVLHGLIDSSTLLSALNLRIPRVNARLRSPFYTTNNLNKQCPLVRSSELYNVHTEKLDIFDSCFQAFHLSLRTLF